MLKRSGSAPVLAARCRSFPNPPVFCTGMVGILILIEDNAMTLIAIA